MSTSFRPVPAVAKECHDREGKEPFPVLLPCQHQGDTRPSHWQTLGSEPAAKPSNRWHEPHYIMPSYWWLLRQVDITRRYVPTTCEPTGNTETWGSLCSKLHSERGLSCNTPAQRPSCPRSTLLVPPGGPCTADDGFLFGCP